MEQKEKKHSRITPKTLLLSFFIIGILCFSVAALLSYQLVSRVHQDQFPTLSEQQSNQIESWMTIRYIAHAYHIPEQLLIKKLTITEKDARKDTLSRLAQKKHISTDTLISQIKQLLLKHSPPRPPTLVN